jgi:hypothetical protein
MSSAISATLNEPRLRIGPLDQPGVESWTPKRRRSAARRRGAQQRSRPRRAPAAPAPRPGQCRGWASTVVLAAAETQPRHWATQHAPAPPTPAGPAAPAGRAGLTGPRTGARGAATPSEMPPPCQHPEPGHPARPRVALQPQQQQQRHVHDAANRTPALHRPAAKVPLTDSVIRRADSSRRARLVRARLCGRCLASSPQPPLGIDHPVGRGRADSGR